jgi:hypothetical protein
MSVTLKLFSGHRQRFQELKEHRPILKNRFLDVPMVVGMNEQVGFNQLLMLELEPSPCFP